MALRRPQFLPEERNMLVRAYARYRGKGNCFIKVKEEFSQQFPRQKVPPSQTIYKMWKKQNTMFTVHNLRLT